MFLRRRFAPPLLLGLLAGACTGGYAIDADGVAVYPDPVVIGPAPAWRPPIDARPSGDVDIPPGHYPPPGACRVWFPDRPPGQQPPPGSCGVRVPRGAVLVRG